MIFEILLLLFSLTVMLLIVYLYRKQWTRAPPTDPVAAPPPPDTTKKCRFLYSDIDNEHTFTVYEDSVKDPYIRVDCDKCNQYVYKKKSNEKDMCTSAMFDPLENINIDDSGLADQMCDPKHPERGPDCVQPHGVCSKSTAPSQICPF